MDEKNKNGLTGNKQINDSELENVTGGYKGIFPKWKIIKTYCDFCNKKIDGIERSMVPILGDKVMCNECFEKQKQILGTEVANKKWLGYSDNIKRTETTINTTNNTSYTKR